MAGAQKLRDAFNGVASPDFTCTLALMDTKRAHDSEFEILTFVGTKSTGEKFTFSSRPVKRGEDVFEVATETAQKLIDQESKP